MGHSVIRIKRLETMRATPTLNDRPLRHRKISTLAEALDHAAQGATGYNFYSSSGKLSVVLPYSELRETARGLARKLTNLGLPRGSRAALVADTHPDFVRFFFACQYAGLTPVPLPAQLNLSGRRAYIAQLERLLANCQAQLAVATDDFLPFLTRAAANLNIPFVGSSRDYDRLPDTPTSLHPIVETELAYLQYTSGSTRFPRGVMITQKAVLSNLSAIIEYGIRTRPGDRAVSWLPFYHDMGLVGLLLAPMVGQLSVDFLNTRHFAMRPRLWLKLMSENRGTISFSPPFGYELAAHQIRDHETPNYDLSAWRVAGVGAEMIRKDSLEHFAARFEPSGFHRRAFLPCYGMAECSLAVTFGLLGKGVQTDCVDADCLAADQKAEPTAFSDGNGRVNEFVSCGTPLPGYEIEIRDSSGRVLPERSCGALYLRGPSVMTGYFGDAKATRENLTPDGWLNTGDLAYRIGESVLITGRQKDLIIINGRNVWPQDLEYLAERYPEIRTGYASAFSITEPTGEERAVVMVQGREQDTRRLGDLRKRLRRAIREELGIDCIIAFVPRNTLIRTTSGKPSRQGAKKVYLERAMANSRTHPSERPYAASI